VCVPVGSESGSTVNVRFGCTRLFIGPKLAARGGETRHPHRSGVYLPPWRIRHHEHFHEEDVRGDVRRRLRLVTRSSPSCACVYLRRRRIVPARRRALTPTTCCTVAAVEAAVYSIIAAIITI